MQHVSSSVAYVYHWQIFDTKKIEKIFQPKSWISFISFNVATNVVLHHLFPNFISNHTEWIFDRRAVRESASEHKIHESKFAGWSAACVQEHGFPITATCGFIFSSRGSIRVGCARSTERWGVEILRIRRWPLLFISMLCGWFVFFSHPVIWLRQYK
jgi:hypothetical protein